MTDLSDSAENALLDLILHGVTWPGIAENVSVGAATQIFIGLHSADPGEAGGVDANELSYSGYARYAMGRDAGGWAIAGSNATPVAPIEFPQATGSSPPATHFTMSIDAEGAGEYILRGTINPPLTIGEGTIPQLTTGTTLTFD